MLLNLVGICLVLGKFLNAASTASVDDATEPVDFATPEVIKSNFIDAINQRNLEQARTLAKDNEYLVDQFNSDIFEAILNCYMAESATVEEEHICDPFYNLVAEGLDNLSMSKTTPMIMAIASNNLIVFNKLLKDDIKHLEAVDENRSTALMYSAILDHEYMMMQMIRNLPRMEAPADWINMVDASGKTALHYICESGRSEEHKVRWIQTLIENGARVADAPAYAADVWNLALRKELSTRGGVVEHKNFFKLVDMVGQIGQHLLTLFILYDRSAAADVVVPPLFLLWNSLPLRAFQALFFYLGQLILPGFDSNVVISFDLPSGTYDISINLIMIAFFVLINSEQFKNMKNELKY